MMLQRLRILLPVLLAALLLGQAGFASNASKATVPLAAAELLAADASGDDELPTSAPLVGDLPNQVGHQALRHPALIWDIRSTKRPFRTVAASAARAPPHI